MNFRGNLTSRFQKKKFNALLGTGVFKGAQVILAKPMSFMNLSGEPVRRLADFYKVSGKDLLIIHDDIDLALGRLKIKSKGGHGGHNGLKSIINTLGHDGFNRIRMGIGRNPATAEGKEGVIGHVLGKMSPSEADIISQTLETAVRAAVLILDGNITEAMNRYNGTGGTIDQKEC